MPRVSAAATNSDRSRTAQIVARMETAAGGGGGSLGETPAQEPRLALYSGHNTTIMPLLVTLGGDLAHWPPYVSNLVRS